jgi:hypothetical protein
MRNLFFRIPGGAALALVEGARAEEVKTAKCINYRQKEAENGPASFYNYLLKGF